MVTEFYSRDSREPYASDAASPFDASPSDEKTHLLTQAKHIVYKTKAGTINKIILNSNTPHNRIIFEAFSHALESDWFTSLLHGTQVTYYDKIRDFVNWLNEHGHLTVNGKQYRCLKDYEAYTMNERGLATSPLLFLNTVIKEGITSPYLSNNNQNYIYRLLARSKPIHTAEKESPTLTNWFALPWLRDIIGEREYLQLESPRRLILSFRVTIAVTLLYLLDVRKQWQNFKVIDFDTSYDYWQYDWDMLLFYKIARFDKSGEPIDDISGALWADCIKPSYKKKFKEKLKIEPCKSERGYNYNWKQRGKPWLTPVFFHPSFQEHYSPVEELLLAWLAACEAIQPSDIPKLKTTDYAQEFNTSGRLIMMQCLYYKGRAGTTRQPAILMAADPWTKALARYMDLLPNPGRLFRTNPLDSIVMPGIGPHFQRNTLIGFLFNIWKTPDLQQRIESELIRAQVPPIFLRAVLALENCSEPYVRVSKKTTSIANYKESFPRPLPPYCFSLTHIKNSAVHSQSDTYRDEDLINHNSHTSSTEKYNYLTDSNKEWVNSCGRITRLVLHDLQNTVYQPSVEAIQQSVMDLETRTKIIQSTSSSDLTVHTLQQPVDTGKSDYEILVSDSLDTALYFIHYISQAELMFQSLLSVRPDFVERTLLIQVEWMTRTLSKMRETKSASAQYNALRECFPSLFDHLLETAE